VTVHAVDLHKPREGLADVLRDASLVVTVSEYNRCLIRERYGVEATVVRCGVDPMAFPPAKPEDPPVLLSVGRWVPKKGLDTLAAAALRLDRRAVVRIYSDAPALPGVEARGLRSRTEVAAAYGSATAFVLPCRRAPDGDLDGIPVALMEAMAAGLPVVTTAVSGIPELVDDAVGWLVPPDDPEALAATLRAVLDDPAEAARRGRNGRERVAEHWSAETAHATMRRLLGG
jgi:glycosyltransferase involved in cell wall biosynthesis